MPPIVFINFHPPKAVPSAIAPALAAITQVGTSNLVIYPFITNPNVIMPIVFWASFVPWLKASATAVTICDLLKKLFIRGEAPLARKKMNLVTKKPKMKPMIGAVNNAMRIF